MERREFTFRSNARFRRGSLIAVYLGSAAAWQPVQVQR
jgi:hypothetical protein